MIKRERKIKIILSQKKKKSQEKGAKSKQKYCSRKDNLQTMANEQTREG